MDFMKSLPSLKDLKNAPGSTPYPIWISSLTTASLIPLSFSKRFGLAPPLALFGFSIIYGGIGVLTIDDPVAGCSIASAWGIIHIASLAKQTLKQLKFLPLVHLAIVTTSTGIYFKEFIQDF